MNRVQIYDALVDEAFSRRVPRLSTTISDRQNVRDEQISQAKGRFITRQRLALRPQGFGDRSAYCGKARGACRVVLELFRNWRKRCFPFWCSGDCTWHPNTESEHRFWPCFPNSSHSALALTQSGNPVAPGLTAFGPPWPAVTLASYMNKTLLLQKSPETARLSESFRPQL